MAFECHLCTGFIALTFSILLNHLNRVHGNKPNFHVVCGFRDCFKTCNTFEGYRSHLRRNHNDILANAENVTSFDGREERAGEPGHNQDNPDRNDDNAGGLGAEPHGQLPNVVQPHLDLPDPRQRKTESASFILRMKEIHSLTQKAVDSIVSDSSNLIRYVVEHLCSATNNCLRAAGIDLTTVPNLEQVFYQDSPIANPFRGLMTHIEQNEAFKDLFGLVASFY
jgi:hypothetical protein